MLRTESDIRKDWHNSDGIMVSICCICYNQKDYIRKCLDGIFMQVTNFPYEILLHDDASTDGTTDIIKEYEKKYPTILKPLYEEENQWEKGLRGSFVFNLPRSKGKYIAFCEGDDYWTDPLKLQKQVDFLEGHEDVRVCFHRVNVIVPNERKMLEDYHVIDVPGESSIIDLAKIGNYIPTNSAMYRNDNQVYADVSKVGSTPIGDYTLWMMCAQYGKIYKLPDNMAVYRYGVGSWQSKPKICQYINILNLLNRLRMVLHDVQAIKVLDDRINDMTSQIIDMERKDKEQLKMIKGSRTYRLGNFIAKPMNFVRKIFKG